jgi:adsorption protein B
MLYRDRKAVFTHLTNFFAYFLMFHFIAYWIYAYTHELPWRFPPFVDEAWMWDFIYLNTLFMTSRFLHRFYFTAKTYDLTEAFLSIPRLFWGNVINMAAMFRAYRQVRYAKKSQQKVQWDKTDHEFLEEGEG